MAAFPWDALITAGGSLLGGLFGSNAQKEQAKYMKKYNKNKIQWTVADAQKAGIHPLAALGSPVAGSFAAPPGGSPMGDAIGDAAAAIGSGISRSEALARSREQDELNKDLLRAQIRNMDAGTMRTLAAATSRTGIAQVRESSREPRDEYRDKDLRIGGKWATNKNVSSADVWTGRLGDSELAQTLMLLGILGADIGTNAGRGLEAGVGAIQDTDWYKSVPDTPAALAPDIDWGASP